MKQATGVIQSTSSRPMFQAFNALIKNVSGVYRRIDGGTVPAAGRPRCALES